MTWFHICTANHNETGRDSLTDQVDWITAGLLEAGHQVTMSTRVIEAAAINLFWECFHPSFADRLIEINAVYGIVATEIPDGVGFNWRDEPWWNERFDAFSIAAIRASFIWVLVESALPFYSQFAPSAYLELGFSEYLVPNYIDHTPSIDFSFFGQRTPYREAAVERLRRFSTVDWPEHFLPHPEVHKMVARSKIGLNFKQSAEWPVPSGPRLGRLMLAKRGVASEFLTEPTRQGEISGVCPPNVDFVDYALTLLQTDWRERAEQIFENYRCLMPMKDIMTDVVSRTTEGLQTMANDDGAILLPLASESWATHVENAIDAGISKASVHKIGTREGILRKLRRFWMSGFTL